MRIWPRSTLTRLGSSSSEKRRRGSAAHRGDARVVLGDGGADADGIGTLAHRSQLQQLEDDAVPADAALAVDDGAAGLQLDRDRGGQQDRRDEHQPDRRDRQVGRARGSPLAGLEAGRDLEPLLLGVAHRVPSTFSQPIGTAPALIVPEPDCDRGGHGDVVGHAKGEQRDVPPQGFAPSSRASWSAMVTT